MEQLIFIALLVAVGFVAGRSAEMRHLKSIRRRERQLVGLPAITSRGFDDELYDSGQLVCGGVVVSIDYFKRIWANLRNIVGGRVRAYESVLDRGRREAVLRMKEEAQRLGANAVYNVRVETSQIGGNTQNGQALGSVEVVAYGTAVIQSKVI